MRRGTIYRRCAKCGRKVPKKTCSGCGYERFSWAYVVDTGHAGGKRRQQSKSGFATKAEANAALANVQVDLSKGMYVEASRVTLEEFLNDEWLPAIEGTLRPTTFDSYRELIRNHIVPALGSARLQTLTPSHLNGFYSTLGKTGRRDGTGGLSPRTVRYIHTILHRALKDAVRWNRLIRNVAELADPPKASAHRDHEYTTWAPEELRNFLSSIADHRLDAAFVVLAMTGLRRGELLGLQWDDVDLKNRSITIRRARVAVRYDWKISEPKTRSGRRLIALDKITSNALRTHRKRQLEERMQWGPGWHDNGFVFTAEDGSLFHPDHLTKLFDRLVKRAGIPRIRLHDLRHTHATLALQRGIHPKVISERLGHASIGITLDTYSHAFPALQEDAAEQIAAMVFD